MRYRYELFLEDLLRFLDKKSIGEYKEKVQELHKLYGKTVQNEEDLTAEQIKNTTKYVVERLELIRKELHSYHSDTVDYYINWIFSIEAEELAWIMN